MKCGAISAPNSNVISLKRVESQHGDIFMFWRYYQMGLTLRYKKGVDEEVTEVGAEMRRVFFMAGKTSAELVSIGQ